MATLKPQFLSDFKGMTFYIPSQQRGYKWSVSNIQTLLNDLMDFYKSASEGSSYCMQPIAVVENGINRYELLDGQQRLTTFYLINKALDREPLYELEFERDTEDCQVSRMEFLKNPILAINDENSDFFYMSKAYLEIRQWLISDEHRNIIESLFDTAENRSIEFLVYQIDKHDNKHAIFRNLNSGKIALTNAELIKAVLVLDDSITNKDIAISQYISMEHGLRNNRFWNMISSSEPAYNRSRLDVVFNLALHIDEDTYRGDRFTALNLLLQDPNGVSEKWKQIRQTYTLLYDFYNDPYCYHYIGFLTYCKDKIYLQKILDNCREKSYDDFVSYLRGMVKKIVCTSKYPNLSYYRYGIPTFMLRRLFVLHNIETILARYETIHKKDKSNSIYEQFPFDLLYSSEGWDIEHISSQTDNPLRSEVDWDDWVKSTQSDFENELSSFSDLFEKYQTDKSEANFKDLYSKVVEHLDNLLGEDKVVDKDVIGNLVLLDKHTNRSFHNSLYPRKRKIIIMADGNVCADDGIDIQTEYIPICTKQVFMKFYNKRNNIKMKAWTQSDCDAYQNDIESKLGYFFK